LRCVVVAARLCTHLLPLFGAPPGPDPYVLYDDLADRWYVIVLDSTFAGLFVAVSNDGDPTHGFLPTYHLTDLGGSPDYPKPGFNQDAVFIAYNAFGPSFLGDAAIVTLDKAAALSGTLTYFVSHPERQFRAMPPAQMHTKTDRHTWPTPPASSGLSVRMARKQVAPVSV
jgi:hypothetical protein